MYRHIAAIALLHMASTVLAQEVVRPPFLDAINPPPNEVGVGEVKNPFEDRIETDRDAFTPTPRTVGLNRLVIESAYSFIDNRGRKETHSFPELLLRYGISEFVELRLGWNYEVGGEGNTVSGSGRFAESGEGESPIEEAMRLVRETQLTYGVKARLMGQNEWLPESSVIVMGATPTSGAATNTDVLAALVWGWELPNKWKVDMAIRYSTEKEEADHFNIFSPSAVLRIPVDERCTIHGEYFGFFTHGKEVNSDRQFLSAGVSYLVTSDLELGVRGGPGLNSDSARWFINAGFGWRY